jgi:hypothetical protein
LLKSGLLAGMDAEVGEFEDHGEKTCS